MLDKLLNAAVKRLKLDKFIYNVSLSDERTYSLTLGTKDKSVKVYFEVQQEYRDEVELVLSLLS